MGVFTVRAPDGNEYDVTAPDTATDQEVLAYAQATYGKAPPIGNKSSQEAIEALTKTYAHTIEPGIQYLQGLAPTAVQGLGNIAGTLVSGGDTKFAEELGQDWASKIPQIPITDIGVQKQEALGHYLQQSKEKGGDVAATMSPIARFNEPLARGLGEVVGELGPQALLFGGARRMAGIKPKITPEALGAARKAMEQQPPPMTPPPSGGPMKALPDLTTDPRFIQDQLSREGVPPPVETPPGELNYPPIMGMEQSVLPLKGTMPFKDAPEPVYRPPFTLEGNYERLQEPPRPTGEPQPSPLTSLEPRDTTSANALRAAQTERLALLEQEASAAMRRGDMPGAEAAKAERDTLLAKDTIETTDFPLRQEELIKLRENYERWIKQAEQEGNTKLVEELKTQFAEELPDYGVRSPREAVGMQPLYEQGMGTRLPVESSQRPLLGSPGTWGERNPYAPAADAASLRIGGRFAKQAGPGGKQGGAIDFTFRKGEGKEIPIEDRIRIFTKQSTSLDLDLGHLLEQEKQARAKGDLNAVRALGSEIEATQKMLDRVNLGLAKTEELQKRTKAPVIPLGLTKKGESQKGSIGFDKDKEFEAFKAKLPAPFKSQAKALYRAVRDELKAKATLIPEVEQSFSQEAVKGIPGLKNVVDMWGDKVRPAEEFIPDLLKYPGGDAKVPFYTAGARMAAMRTEHPLHIYIAKLGTTAQHEAHRLKIEKISDEKTGIAPKITELRRNDPEAFLRDWEAMWKKEGTGEGVKGPLATPLRELLDWSHDYLNDVLKLMGRKPVHKRGNYLPGGPTGEFRFSVRDKVTGEFIKNVGHDNRWAANKLYDEFSKNPAYVVSRVEHTTPVSRESRIGTMEDLDRKSTRL